MQNYIRIIVGSHIMARTRYSSHGQFRK